MYLRMEINAEEVNVFETIVTEVKKHFQTKEGRGTLVVEISDALTGIGLSSRQLWSADWQRGVFVKIVDFLNYHFHCSTFEEMAELVGIDRGDFIKLKNGAKKIGSKNTLRFTSLSGFPEKIAQELHTLCGAIKKPKEKIKEENATVSAGI